MKQKLNVVIGILVATFLFQSGLKVVLASTVEYPFESIRITDAKTFQVIVPDNLPSTSMLTPRVNVGERLSIYFAGIDLVRGDYTQPTAMIVVTNELGQDLARYVINRDAPGELENEWAFAWHILIDPTVGIYKDLILSSDMKEFHIVQNIASNTWTFQDDQKFPYLTVADSFLEEDDLNIEIAAYVEASKEDATQSERLRLYQFVSTVANIGLTSCANPTSSSPSSISNDFVALEHYDLINELSQQIKAVFAS